jgi:hypothetical protein
MATKIEKLLVVRERLISELKHHIGVITEFNDTTSHSLIRLRRAALRASSNALQENWRTLEITPDPKHELKNSTDFLTVNQSMEDEYFNAIVRLDEILPESGKAEKDKRVINHHSDNEDDFNSQIKLPAIQLQKFSGEFDDWLEFRDTFQACFSQKKKISDCQKFLYLKGLLGDEPSLLIKNLKATNENYKAAWEILESRYNNKRRIVYTHFRTLLELSPIRDESSKELRRVLDTANSSMTAIKLQTDELGQLDQFIVYLISQKLDKESKKHWEEYLKASTELPDFKKLNTFLETRFNILDGINNSSSYTKSSSPSPHKGNHQNNRNHAPKAKHEKTFHTTATKIIKCTICTQGHKPFECNQLKRLPVAERRTIIEEKQLCTNCFYDHSINDCKCRFVCSVCGQKHHTMLHTDQNQAPAQAAAVINHLQHSPSSLLATARVAVQAQNGSTVILRAYIDQCSTTNLISEAAASLIQTKRQSTNVPIMVAGKKTTCQIRQKTKIVIGSIHDNYKIHINALILSSVAEVAQLPSTIGSNWPHLNGLQLADPEYFNAGEVDLLLGVDTHAAIILAGLKKGPIGTPIAQKTELGWIISGPTGIKTEPKMHFTHLCMLSIEGTGDESESLHNRVKKFCELEEIEEKTSHTPEEERCEELFVTTTTTTDDGRYMVRLPFKIDPSTPNFLGDSYKIAHHRYAMLERKFNKNPVLFNEYKQYIDSFLEAKHIRPATVEEINDTRHSYFMPHHAVFKESSTSTKIRVVFDASCETTNGFSLNNRLLIGPIIQSDIFTIIVRWRQYPIAFTADITKMYLQFWVHPEDAKYQRILWRENGEIRQFVSHTITFGTASAPFQAIRLLHLIASEAKESAPLAAELLLNHFYVDDCAGGAEDELEAIEKYHQLNKTLDPRGLNLRKWTSNSDVFLQHIPLEYQETKTDKRIAQNETIKALGLHWRPHYDELHYTLTLPIREFPPTKRTFLSDFSMCFDPVGWLQPVIIIPRILMQHIWLKGIGWDEPLPDELCDKWLSLRTEIQQLEDIKIPRWSGASKTAKHNSLHGFSDASEQALAAVLYLRTQHSDNTITCRIIASKSKVAPLKKISLPRLELDAAHLLVKLIKKSKETFTEPVEIRAYTDSTITLCWISSHPAKWKTYVANRTTEIQAVLPAEKWFHVKSNDNPADCASRGMLPKPLANHKIWWNGPSFLLKEPSEWPTTYKTSITKCEERTTYKSCFLVNTIDTSSLYALLNRSSSIHSLLKITAYCIRIFRYKSRHSFLNQIITTSELNHAELVWVRLIQELHFHEELARMKTKLNISNNSKLVSFTPFIANDSLIRARGRLSNSCLPYEAKHPAILPPDSHFTWLLVENAHIRTHHGGVQLVIQYVRHKYRIIHDRTIIKKYIRSCVRCHRYKAAGQKQVMGDLPDPRVQPSLPFTHTGVDFAGYFDVKTSSIRNAPYTKCYIALFVCLSVKAIHLELVEDLSTEAFLAAFRRFAARRGIPAHIYSDNGTNFVGASNELPRLLTKSTTNQSQEVTAKLVKDGTQWHFIPPYAPHFGGLWEAGVKSTKHHLKRTLNETRIQHQPFNTLLTQIEAVLNSRPLCPLTADPDDLEPLTPGHFLIGRPLNVIPNPDYRWVPQNRLSHYQYMQKLLQNFWHKWSEEYLHRLQNRPKWAQSEPNIRTGQLILIKDDNLPPGKWSRGRITQVIPGADNNIRVVEIRTATTTTRRPITKICLLPIIDNEN